MRLIIQRVSEATVSINRQKHSEIKQGMLVLVGFTDTDNTDDLEWAAPKICSLRIFNDNEGKMNRSIMEVNGELLIVSQFTLYAQTKKGNRPSYVRAAKPDIAIPLYNLFVEHCKRLLPGKVKTGVFGADMKIGLTNDGPVTIFMDTKNKE